MPDGTELQPSTGDAMLQVGDWTVEPALNQLSAGGKTCKLEPKAMALLRYLAERPGQVVSREALLSAVWPGVVVGDDSLTQAVIKLRKALGDTAESPAYIQTIPKGGYRLVAPVAVKEATVPEPTQIDTPTAHVVRRSRRGVFALAGVAALLVAAAAAWWINDDRVSVSPGASATAEATRAAKPSVSIRAFEALGDEPQVALLARGLTADLVTDLSKVFGLSVIADTPSPGPAAATPPSRYLVTGSVQRAGDRLRLHVHLTDAQTGKQLWSERFDRPVSGLFAIQEELGPKILQILPAKVSEAELRRLAQHHTRNLEAYEYFQRGQMALLARRHEENELAREMFRRAIALDASFAAAYAALAQTYAADHRNQWTQDRAAAIDRAFELARTAQQINPDVRETYWVLALVHLDRGRHKEALEYLETAIRLSPSFADAYALMGGITAYMGEPADAVPLVRTAMRLNPDGGYLYFLILGRAYFGLGDLEQARLNLEHALLRNPVNLEARVYMAASLVSARSKTEAGWQAEEIRALQPGFSSRVWLATHPLRDAKTQARLVQTLGELGF
ncbi:MAG TPA: winged helix-turn-helix domain-containing protein [Chthoniobacteraceae bacterium]|nr:winged helix-turn-helix domain-containing protein [Chthoniobacteraceae bacterium]